MKIAILCAGSVVLNIKFLVYTSLTRLWDSHGINLEQIKMFTVLALCETLLSCFIACCAVVHRMTL